MADGRGPFERVFDPDNQGTISGFMGRMLGHQTGNERVGAIQGQAMKELSDIQAQGNLTPQQTILEFMKTPTGMQLFSSGDPNSLAVLSNWAKTVTAPTPQVQAGGPNQPVYETGPGYVRPLSPAVPHVQGGQPGQPLISTGPGTMTNHGNTPPVPVQEFNAYQAIAKVPEEKLRALAEDLMKPPDQRTTQPERAIYDMIKNKQIDEVTGKKILGGIIQVKKVLNIAGEDTGLVSVVDISVPGSAPTVVKPSAAPNPDKGATQVTPENPRGIKDPDKLTMFLGSGFFPKALSYLDSFVKNMYDPSLDALGGVGETATQRNRYLTQVQVALTQFPEGDGKTNLVINEFKKLFETGWGTDSLDAVRNGIKLYDLAQRELAVDEKVNNVTHPKDQVIKAQRRVEGWNAILRSLPDRADMTALEKSIQEGTAGAVGLKGAYETLKKGVVATKDAVTAGPQPRQDAPKPSAATPVQPDPEKPTSEAPKPAQPAVKVGDIDTMPVAALLKLDPATLTPQQNQQLLKRIPAIRAELAKRRGAKEK